MCATAAGFSYIDQKFTAEVIRITQHLAVKHLVPIHKLPGCSECAENEPTKKNMYLVRALLALYVACQHASQNQNYIVCRTRYGILLAVQLVKNAP